GFTFDIIIGEGAGARAIKLPLKGFTLIGATTRTGLLTGPLRDRFRIVNPRIANRLLRRVRDFADVDGDGRITQSVADRALARLEVDHQGLDPMDRKILVALIDKFNGGPVGLD